MYIYKINITSIYDGDTMTGDIDLGFNIKKEKVKLRLARINTPEIRTKDLKEKERGYAARDWLREFVEKYKDAITVNTTKKGKYGRWISEILISADDCGYDEELEKYQIDHNGYYCINDILVAEDYAEYKEY